MLNYRYPVQETINGVTLTYNGPEQDPVTVDRADGDLEDYALWVDGDPHATHVVMDVNTGDQKIKVLARQSKQSWWKYKVDVSTSPATFRRRQKGGDWEPDPAAPAAPVTSLRIKLASEAAEHPIDLITISNDNARIQYRGSNCAVIWNPATRRYSLQCN